MWQYENEHVEWQENFIINFHHDYVVSIYPILVAINAMHVLASWLVLCGIIPTGNEH